MLVYSSSRLGVAEGEELETNILRMPALSSDYQTVLQGPFLIERLRGAAFEANILLMFPRKSTN
jgi:hypothetical protein